ncbi:hypothetical protein P148_SR1C00001G0451 [candidate division SR1 bacterium RAAC1_SR1_1]|nr:hypothetical protein P148_SR1C00001G0451 [candidate division SR1 bacterium RAAC1_SR1_1]
MHKQYLTPIKSGTLADVKLGSHTVFEETDEKGILQQCTGLEYIIKIEPNIIVVDNHDRVLEFRPKGFPVLHIDQHTDMRPVGPDGVNVGNFLRYALDTQLITGSSQINTEYSLLNLNIDIIESDKTILDIDLDFRHPDMSIEQFEKTIQIVKGLIKKAKIVTIATSPYFLDQDLAIKLLKQLID